jgi:Arc/MetJ-type ribon-helix-helix transcriptional regulator
MLSRRAPGQKLISLAVSETFLERVDAALSRAGYGDRSQFIRDAVVEKLSRAGIEVPLELATSPSRRGKGGRKPRLSAIPAMPDARAEIPLPPVEPPSAMMLNDGPVAAHPLPAAPVTPIRYGPLRRAAKTKK